MEILHMGFLQLIDQDMNFTFHWKCEASRVFQLGFADDLILFCRADIDSIRVLKNGLDRFASWSGLRLNIEKSHLIISKSAQNVKEQLLGMLGFQEGHLPMRYLGLALSYAGRVQLIKSVLMAFSVYWGSPFILPKGVLREIEKRLRSFLWKGRCTLCDEGAEETHTHIFFRCRYSRGCLAAIRHHIRFAWPNREWSRDVEWASRKWRGKHIVNVAYRALLGACIYHIWRERNLRRFEHTHRPEAVLATCIIEDVRQRIISSNLPGSISTCTLYRLWRIPWSVGVAWKDVCKPKEEGGLGLRDVGTLNRALMCKKLCEVIRCDRTSIWVDWLISGRLRDSSIWTIPDHQGPWGWRKLLCLRTWIRSIVEYRIGDGSEFYLWKNPWHTLGPLIDRFPRGPSRLGLHENATLNSVMQENQWQWPLITDMECLEIIHTLPCIYGGSDRIIWRFMNGSPTTQELYRLMMPPGPKVDWISLLSGPLKIPRHMFILWLAILEKLATTDKPWLSHLGHCVLCNDDMVQSHDHLFFHCRFSRRCISTIRRMV
ncbi:UNVERIFIED_CONTAM: putative mitochondrial protein [Sesamum indicum]